MNNPGEGFTVLLDIIKDFLQHSEALNEKRILSAERDVKYAMEDVKIFNLLQENLQKIEARYVLPQDQ